ncbi:MAG TPA: type III-B CRISPR module RAMP protein Cmr1 [Chthoniobacterales bacterium]
MPRSLPSDFVVPEKPTSNDSGVQTLSLDIQVITPLFGGGATPGECDPVTLIRGTTIRGHLRFWWRATVGAQFATWQELAEAEEKLWGSASNPSQISIVSTVTDAGKKQRCATFPPDKSFARFEPGFPAYALFPFQGKKKNGRIEEEPALACTGVKFRLDLTYPDTNEHEVKVALKAWINFGGIGARTRRGCGSLLCHSFSPASIEKIGTWHQGYQRELDISRKLGSRASKDWPIWQGQMLVGKSERNAGEAWADVIGLLRYFRQGQDFGRNPGRDRPGRSRWPEPEAVRRSTGRRSRSHSALSQFSDLDFYPRAELGLPIVVHFKDANTGDPEDTQVVPWRENIRGEMEAGERMCSPVLLKVLATVDGAFAPAIIALNTPGVDAVALQSTAPVSDIITNQAVGNSTLAHYTNSPLSGLSDSGSSLEAFLKFAQNDGYFLHQS